MTLYIGIYADADALRVQARCVELTAGWLSVAVGGRASTALDPHEILDDRLVPGTLHLDV